MLFLCNSLFQFSVKNVSPIQQGLNMQYEKEDRWENLYFKYNNDFYSLSISILYYFFLSQGLQKLKKNV